MYIDNRCTDIYFNLAAEEYMLKNFNEDVLMIWQSNPTVVIGKHQDVYAEVNINYVNENHIKIARRYSGGGTVFHDLGNLNITFIETVERIDFDKYIVFISDVLSELGLHTRTDERRALFLSDRKISGSAQCVYKNRVLFHLTLLFDSDLEALSESLNTTNSLPRTKTTVRSVKSPVDNIKRHLPASMEMEEFRNRVATLLLRKTPTPQYYEWKENDMATINTMRTNKYTTTSWNIGISR